MKKQKFIYIVYLSFPIINLITGLTTRFNLISISVGSAIRGLLLLSIVIYLIFFSKNKRKKVYILYLISALLFVLIYVLKSNMLVSFYAFYYEGSMLIKFLYLPILYLGFISLVQELGIDEKKWQKIFLFSLIFYLIFIMLPIILKSSFNSYVHEQYGLVGWFYSANEVGSILLMLFPATFALLDKHKILYLILGFITIFLTIGVGTKVCTYGIGIMIFGYLLFYLIFRRKNKINILLLCITLCFFLFLNSSIGSIVYNMVENYNNGVSNVTEVVGNRITINSEKDYSGDFVETALSGRNLKVMLINENFLNSNYLNKLFGIGFIDDTGNKISLIEMDFFDILYHYGLIGFVLFLMPYWHLCYTFILSIKNRQLYFSLPLLFSIYVFVLISGIALLAGHVLGAPAVSSFLAIYMLEIYVCLRNVKND